MIKSWTRVESSIGLACAFALALGWSDLAKADNPCNRWAVGLLKQHSPTGFDAYRSTQDKSIFNSFSAECADKTQFLDADVISAVHETNHAIRSEKNVYNLVTSELLPVPPAPNYFAPAAIVPALSRDARIRNDVFFKTYLSNKGPDANSSRADFTYLLDEMNAYTNEMQTQIEFARVHPFTNRDAGVPAMMTFVAAYANHARDHAPGVWRDLTASPASPTRLAVGKLWAQAERVLRQACAIAPKSPNEQAAYVGALCNAANTSAISIVLGRQAQCPKECSADLKAAADQADEEEMIEMPAEEDSDARR